MIDKHFVIKATKIIHIIENTKWGLINIMCYIYIYYIYLFNDFFENILNETRHNYMLIFEKLEM